MARHFVELVFDDFVFGSGVVYYTPVRHEGLLGGVTRLALQAVVDQVSGTSPTLDVQAEQTADGRTWANVGPAPEIERAVLSATDTSVATGYVAYAEPRLRLVRLKVSLLGTSPGAHVRIYATGRGAA